MSEEPDLDLADEGRTLAAQAAAKYIDQWEWTAGSVVTGYVLISETVRPDGTVDLTWFTGNGMPTEEQQGGLASWRIAGMCQRVIAEINAGINRSLRHEGGHES
jgi:hypothetical protein